MHELITDEYTALASQYTQYIKIHKTIKNYKKRYFVMTDGTPLFDSAPKTFASVKPRVGKFKVEFTEVSMSQAADFECPGKKRKDTTLFMAYADILDKKYNDRASADELLTALETYFRRSKTYKLSQCALCITVPMPQALDGGVQRLAEREYFAYLASHQDNPRAVIVQQILDLCRRLCGEEKVNVVLYLCDNVIAPDCASISFEGLDPTQIVRDAMESGTVSITDDDYKSYFGCTYIRDVYAAVLYGARMIQNGNVYNISAMNICKADMKLALASAFKDYLKLHCERGTVEKATFTGLDSLKYNSCYVDIGGWKPYVDIEEIMYRLGCICIDREYDMGRMLKAYNGHLDRVRAIELNMLKKFDEICRKHDIQYFVAAGTLLGAVRHHNVIPWDDDFDIGMMRKDYIKLCKVLDSELPEDYIFSHPGNGSKSEYWIDKVRLRETYYTTQYFQQFTIPNGVFLDVFIYDVTSNKKFWQYLHILSINAFALMISTKWTNVARPGRHKRLSGFMRPFLKLVPMKLLHKMFDSNASKYRLKKSSKYVVDTVGLNIAKGALPLDCVNEVTYTDFLGIQVPIPKNYDGYLRHFYGDNYMSLPPVSSRVSGHNFRRLDFGEYLYSDEYTGIIPRIDVRGELFEIPTENK